MTKHDGVYIWFTLVSEDVLFFINKKALLHKADLPLHNAKVCLLFPRLIGLLAKSLCPSSSVRNNFESKLLNPNLEKSKVQTRQKIWGASNLPVQTASDVSARNTQPQAAKFAHRR